MKSVDTTYSDFLSKVISKALVPQYSEDDLRYYLFAPEGNIVVWETVLAKGSNDATDFENNHKASYNQPLEIKAGPGRPPRTAASPQPINTVQHWKGYKLTLGIGQTSTSIDVTFPSLVYVRGGQFYCGNTSTDDSVTVDLIYIPMDEIVLPSIIDHCYLVDNTLVPFSSSESLALATDFKLRVTFSGTSALSARTVYALLEYFV